VSGNQLHLSRAGYSSLAALTLKKNAGCSFGILETTHSITERHTAQDMNP
jgi:hypothetical protein